MSNVDSHDISEQSAVTCLVITQPSPHKCELCQESFTSIKKKKHHLKNFHTDSDKILYSCEMCKKQFKNDKTHRLHMKRQHNVFVFKDASQLNKKCPLCAFSLPSGTKDAVMFQHFTDNHGISITHKELQFNTFREFKTWLPQEEKETNSRYAMYNSRKRNPLEIIRNYVCHRSGFYKPEGQGLRSLALRGSVKINAFCPAGIRLSEDRSTGRCKIIYVSTHVGHTAEDGADYLWLSKKDRGEISDKILNGVPFKTIMDEFNSRIDDGSNNNTLRKLKRKDLNNIKQSLVKSGHLATDDCDPSNVEENYPDNDNLEYDNCGKEWDKIDAIPFKRKATMDPNNMEFENTGWGEVQKLTMHKKNVEKSLDEEKRDLKQYLISLVDSIDSDQKMEDVKTALEPLFEAFPSVVVNGPLDVNFFIKT